MGKAHESEQSLDELFSKFPFAAFSANKLDEYDDEWGSEEPEYEDDFEDEGEPEEEDEDQDERFYRQGTIDPRRPNYTLRWVRQDLIEDTIECLLPYALQDTVLAKWPRSKPPHDVYYEVSKIRRDPEGRQIYDVIVFFDMQDERTLETFISCKIVEAPGSVGPFICGVHVTHDSFSEDDERVFEWSFGQQKWVPMEFE
ncbi:MAG: hypothetical protein Q4B54_12810 [Coriobacteriales bacterium]|nr:hypothetical protein [Coriobacteriales bacterium]